MILHYSANGLMGRVYLPNWYREKGTPEEMAEFATIDHWRAHPDSRPTFVTVVHLHNVEGHDLGLFEVHCQWRSVYTATALQQA
ncbi:hypothetical protein SOP86_05390 [Pseudomonas canadensis]|uniref:hypothetical protein n=1 Tax=Pseudomonas canadensis TaxID=915099 RepID=UPI002B248CFE|nr:hypothetical protein [Pseudomonas canadensis]MEB2645082.1 hypothetical protein [Pseudomonas canadensis]